MRSRLQGAFYARAFLGMWYTFAAYLRQFTVRRSHLRKRCGEKERGAMSGSTFVSALSFDSGSPLFSFDSGSPLFSVDSGSPLFSFDSGSPFFSFDSGSALFSVRGCPRRTSLFIAIVRIIALFIQQCI
jgi:hypothetical protein